MFVQTNYNGIIPRYLKEYWYAWVPEQHFWHFLPKTLKYLMKKKKLKYTDSVFTPLVHPHNWLYKLSDLVPIFRDQYIIVFKK